MVDGEREREPFFGETSPSHSSFWSGPGWETTIWHHTRAYQLVQVALLIEPVSVPE